MENNLPLRSALKKLVIQECNVKGVSFEQIGDEEVIIGGTGALRLDSLDAVEIVTSLERCFGLQLDSAGESRKVFKSFAVMSDYVVKNSTSERIATFVAKYT